MPAAAESGLEVQRAELVEAEHPGARRWMGVQIPLRRIRQSWLRLIAARERFTPVSRFEEVGCLPVAQFTVEEFGPAGHRPLLRLGPSEPGSASAITYRTL